jgi:hypothetical protein
MKKLLLSVVQFATLISFEQEGLKRVWGARTGRDLLPLGGDNVIMLYRDFHIIISIPKKNILTSSILPGTTRYGLKL